APPHRLLLLGNINGAEAALSQLFQQLVAVDNRAGAFGQRHKGRGGSVLDCRPLHEAVLLKMLRQQLLDALPQEKVLSTSPVKIGGPLLRRGLVDDLEEDLSFSHDMSPEREIRLVSCEWWLHDSPLTTHHSPRAMGGRKWCCLASPTVAFRSSGCR